jgi:MFS family permease
VPETKYAIVTVSKSGPTQLLAAGGATQVPQTAWLALISACFAWMFDAMDLQIFTLVLFPAVSSLINSTDAGHVAATGGLILTCKILSWAIGGIVFSVAADRIGRAKAMLVTVLIYSISLV